MKTKLPAKCDVWICNLPEYKAICLDCYRSPKVRESCDRQVVSIGHLRFVGKDWKCIDYIKRRNNDN